MSEPTYEVRTFARGQLQVLEMSPQDLTKPVEYRAPIQAAGIVNGQQLKVQSVVTLQAQTVEDAFDELERDLDMHAQHALRGAVEQMTANSRKLILPGSEPPLNGRMRLTK